MVIITSAQSILSIMSMVLLGYVLASKEWFDENSSNLFVKLVVNISLPLLLIYNVMTNLGRQKLLEVTKGLIVPFTSIALCYLISIGVSRILNIKEERLGAFRVMFSASNTIFMGLPVNIALFGEKSLPYALLYYIANTVFFWTLGVYELYRDGNGIGERIFSGSTVRKIFSPPLIGFISAVLMILFNIRLPQFILDTCRYMGNLTTPLSMLFIGASMYSIGLKNIRPDVDMAVLLFARFFISPLTVFLMAYIFPIPTLMRDVLIIQSAMPIMANTAMVAKAYNADYEYVSIMIAITTIAVIVVIPLYMAVLNSI